MALTFVTGNNSKFSDLQSIFPNLQKRDIDLPEIQELDGEAIIEAKVIQAVLVVKGPCIVEDTSFYIESLNGLPGPLIKWFLEALKPEGIWDLVKHLENKKAYARTVIGYAENDRRISYFDDVIWGTVVAPRGDQGVGWDPLFLPDGSKRTFGEMTREEKNSMSMRIGAAQKLKDYIKTQR